MYNTYPLMHSAPTNYDITGLHILEVATIKASK
jgi:hypothetical protein